MHTGIVFLRKELAVWFRADRGSAGIEHRYHPIRPTSSPVF